MIKPKFEKENDENLNHVMKLKDDWENLEALEIAFGANNRR